MKRLLSFTFAFALLSSAFAACTMDFNQFEPTGGAAGAAGSTAGTAGSTAGTAGSTAGTSGAAGSSGCSADGDCPSPGPCQDGACNAGTCGGKPSTVDTACNDGGTVCDGAGNCVACNHDSNCPAPTTCDTAAHVCVSQDCMDMMQDGNETDTDCGGGDCGPCADGKDCDVDSDCISKNCSGSGKKTCKPSCSNQIQDGNETDVDCGGSCPNNCENGQMCAGDGDCKSDFCDASKHCATQGGNNGDTCQGDGDCMSGHCAPGGVCCNSACTETCKACDLASSMGSCTNVPAGQDPNSDCSNGEVCDGNGGCAKRPNGATCAAGGDCASSFCTDGVCCDKACGNLCESCNLPGSEGACSNIPTGQDPGNECSGTMACDGNGGCAKLPNGSACGGGGDCATSFCTDGVCCDKACGNLCESCNLSGKIGTCSFIAAGTDPAGECSGMKNCDGSGSCN